MLCVMLPIVLYRCRRNTRNQPSKAHQQYRPKIFSGAETFQGSVVKEEGQPPPPSDPPPPRVQTPLPPPSSAPMRVCWGGDLLGLWGGDRMFRLSPVPAPDTDLPVVVVDAGPRRRHVSGQRSPPTTFQRATPRLVRVMWGIRNDPATTHSPRVAPMDQNTGNASPAPRSRPQRAWAPPFGEGPGHWFAAAAWALPGRSASTLSPVPLFLRPPPPPCPSHSLSDVGGAGAERDGAAGPVRQHPPGPLRHRVPRTAVPGL